MLSVSLPVFPETQGKWLSDMRPFLPKAPPWAHVSLRKPVDITWYEHCPGGKEMYLHLQPVFRKSS